MVQEDLENSTLTKLRIQQDVRELLQLAKTNNKKQLKSKIAQPMAPYGQTIMHLVASSDDLEESARRLLHQLNANPNITDHFGYSPLHIAAHKHSDKIAKLLIKDKRTIIDIVSDKDLVTPLSVAAAANALGIAKSLLHFELNVNHVDVMGRTALHFAVDRSSLEMVDLLLDYGADSNCQDYQGNTSLHYVVKRKKPVTQEQSIRLLEIAKLLLTKGKAQVNQTDGNRTTVLHVAAEKLWFEMVQLLLENGANSDVKDFQENNVLHKAIGVQIPLNHEDSINQVKIANFLLVSMKNQEQLLINEKNAKGHTPLQMAADRGLTDVGRILLMRGAKPNAVDYQGTTALHFAVNRRALPFAKLLLNDYDADVNQVDNQGMSALTIAIQLVPTQPVDIDIIRLLLKCQADPNNQQANRRIPPPLHIALSTGASLEIFDTLIKFKADPDLRDPNGNTVLHYATGCRSKEIVERLLAISGLEKNPKGMLGITPLHLAATFDSFEIAALLLKHKADVNAEDDVCETPLFHAAFANAEQVARLLLRSGASIKSRKGYMSRSILHVAAATNSLEVARLVIEAEPDILNERDQLGLTALHYASYCRHPTTEFVDYLKSLPGIDSSPVYLTPEEFALLKKIEIARNNQTPFVNNLKFFIKQTIEFQIDINNQ